MSRLVRIALALIAIAAIGYAVYHFTRPEEAPVGQLYTVERGSLIETAAATGSIEPNVMVEVKSRASGEVIEMLIREGDVVEAGQLLMRLDPIDTDRAILEARTAEQRVRAELAQAQASLRVAEAELEEIRAQYEISTKGRELGLVSSDAARSLASSLAIAEANLGLRRAAIQAVRAQLQSAQLAVQEAERRRRETEIAAPIAGVILDLEVEKGTIVASAVTNVAGGTTLATLASLDQLRVIGELDEAQIARVVPGQRAMLRVSAYPDREFEGEVVRVSPLGKMETNVVTFDVEIRITDEEADKLRSGMSADIEIVTRERHDQLLVPLMAVESLGRKRFVRMPNGEQREIKTGASDAEHLVVLEGLDEGETILIGAVGVAGGRTGPAGRAPMVPMRR